MNVREFLAQHSKNPIYYPPILMDNGKLAGNHGDSLIELGAQKLFAEFDLNFTDDPGEAGLIMIGGGGNMVEGFTVVPRMFEKFAHSYPQTPLAILPGSFYFPNSTIADLLPADRAAVTLFCRENISARHLQEDHGLPDFCEITKYNDLAFELNDGELVNSVRSTTKKHILIVERWDNEHPEAQLNKGPSLPIKIGSMLPEFARAPLRPLVAKMRGRKKSRFREAADTLLNTNHPEYASLPRIVHDISLPNYGSLEDFTSLIRDAAVVITTRLHVGILAGMAGKETYLFEGGYWKARGIHEYSMSDMPHVKFVDLDTIVAPKT